MAKTNRLPSIDDVPAAEEKQDAVKRVDPESVDASRTAGFFPMLHTFMRGDVKLTREQAIQFRDTTRRLIDTGAKLKDGSFVKTKSDAVRWLLENVEVAK